MTATPSLRGMPMEPLQVDDYMEMATSPYQHADDIPIDDFDADEGPVPDYSMTGDFDFENHDELLDAPQADEVAYQDDEMLDEEAASAVHEDGVDLNMREDAAHDVEDEEILYDEDDNTLLTVHEAVLADPPSEAVTSEPPSKSVDTETQPDVPEDMFATAEEPDQDFPLTTTNENSQHTAAHENEIHTQTQIQASDPNADQVDLAAQHDNEPLLENADDPTDDHEDTHEAMEKSGRSPWSEPVAGSEKIDVETLHQIERVSQEPEGHQVQVDTQAEQLIDEVTESSEAILHPVILNYLGEDMQLFPPADGISAGTYFLAEPDLAYQSFDKLLAACREILGDSLGHDDELVLDVPALGLHVCEDSKYATELSLTQILDVYLTLSLNEGTEQVDALYCVLSSRVSLFTQYAYITEAAREGKAFSEIAADYVDTPEPSEVMIAQPEPDEEHESIAPTKTQPEQIDQALEAQSILATETERNLHDSTHGDISGSVDRTGSQEEPHTEAIPVQESEPITEASHGEEATLHKSEGQQSQSYDHAETVIDSDGHANSSEHLQPDYEKDADTPSSHTVEAEQHVHGPDSLTEPVGEAVEAVDADGTVEHDALSVADDEFDLPNEDEVLPELAVDGAPAAQDTASTFGGPEQADVVQANGHAEADPDAVLDDDEFAFTDENNVGYESNKNTDLLQPVTDSHLDESIAPVTPSKQVTTKRKAVDEEDELDFLDISTPEPKRTRPS